MAAKSDNYVCICKCRSGIVYRLPWNKWQGEPTDRTAEQYRRKYNRSFRAGGVNDYLTRQLGQAPYFLSVQVVRNGKLVARAKGD